MRPRAVRFALSLGFLLVLQEALLRAVFPLPEVLNFDRGRYAPMRATPETRWASDPDGFSFVHALNLHGFRDREWTLEAPAGTTRLLFVGDSFVEGFSVGAADTIPAVFRDLAAADAQRVDVLNLGIGGGDLSTYARLLRDAVPLLRPAAVVFVVFANDVLGVRFDPGWLAEPTPLERSSPWMPRLAYVAGRLRAGERVPRRWTEPPFDFLAPVPDPRNPWSDGKVAGRLSAFVAPEIARAIRRGRFNPVLVDSLPWYRRHLSRPAEIGDHLRALRGYLARFGATLHVVYLPTKSQVSDRYLAAQAEFSPPGSATSLLGEAFGLHARLLAQSCAALDLPCLDLTPALRARDAAGPPLYWSYDDHMRPDGYRAVAEQIYGWWRAE
jgi:lysophospholipase L1-like esterase